MSFPPIPFPWTSLSLLFRGGTAKFMAAERAGVAETAYIVMAIMAEGENGRSAGGGILHMWLASEFHPLLALAA